MMLPLIAITISTALMAVLCLGDPKRLRATRREGSGHASRLRRLLVAGCAAPGLAFLLAGQGAAFLIWLGATALGGWFIALWAAGRGSASAGE